MHPPVRHGLPADGPDRPRRPAPSLFTLLEGCLESGGYIEEPGGRVTGLLYRPFADFTRERYQLQADVITGLGTGRMIRELAQGRLVMASVHKEIRRPDRDPPEPASSPSWSPATPAARSASATLPATPRRQASPRCRCRSSTVSQPTAG